MSSRSRDEDVVRVSVRDASQGFSKLISRVEAGARFIVTKNNRPLARIVPADGENRTAGARRRAAMARLDGLMSGKRRSRNGWTFGGSRDAFHDRSTD